MIKLEFDITLRKKYRKSNCFFIHVSLCQQSKFIDAEGLIYISVNGKSGPVFPRNHHDTYVMLLLWQKEKSVWYGFIQDWTDSRTGPLSVSL